jgi:hypothetical protein
MCGLNIEQGITLVLQESVAVRQMLTAGDRQKNNAVM